MIELLEDKLESARTVFLPKLDINEEQYGLVLDNMNKTIDVLTRLTSGGQNTNENRAEELAKKRNNEYIEWFVNSCTDTLSLDMKQANIDEFEYDTAKLKIVDGIVGLADVWKDKTFVIAFTGDGCASCKTMRPAFFPTIKESYDVLELKLEKYQQYLLALGIKDIPLLFLVKDGIIKHVEVGFDSNASQKNSEKYINDLLDKYLG